MDRDQEWGRASRLPPPPLPRTAQSRSRTRDAPQTQCPGHFPTPRAHICPPDPQPEDYGTYASISPQTVASIQQSATRRKGTDRANLRKFLSLPDHVGAARILQAGSTLIELTSQPNARCDDVRHASANRVTTPMSESNTTNAPLVLIAHAQEWSVRSLESILIPSGFTVLRAHNDRQVLQRTRASRPDILVIDADLPDVGGIELCRLLRTDAGVTPSTPILVLSAGPITRQMRLEALRAGAWGLIGQTLDAEEVVLELKSFVRAKFDADMARDESLLDAATGFYNLRGLLQRARELGADAARYERPMACVVFATGPGAAESADRTDDDLPPAAIRIARTLRNAGRGSDTIGRLGQSEFVVLAPGTDHHGAFHLARRLVTEFDKVEGDSSESLSGLDLRAGYYAVRNFRTAAIDPIDLLVRASMALKQPHGVHGDDRIRSFDLDLDFDPSSPLVNN